MEDVEVIEFRCNMEWGILCADSWNNTPLL